MPKLDCDDFLSLLDAFEDNELDGVTSLSAQEHLDACAACRARRFWHAEARASLRRLRSETPGAPETLRARAQTGIRARRRHWWRPLAAAAALVVAAGAGYLATRPAAEVEPMEYALNHLATLGRTDRVKFPTTNAAEAEAWLGARLGFPLNVPRQPPAGYRLAGARLCSVGGFKVAYLLFEGDASKQPLSLFIAPSGACQPGGLAPVPGARFALRTGDCDGTPVAAWEGRDAIYVLAGDVGLPALLAFTSQEQES
ncbi:MAG TPA: zf-HC2 domain-containing protein [Opitutaceae bacterium]